MIPLAPYAETAIVLSISSINGIKYREYGCIECGSTIVERNNERILLFSNEVPTDAKTNSDGNIPTVCDACRQKYIITVSFQPLERSVSTLPLHMQPQTFFVAAVASKKLRDIHCVECSHLFYSVSDRITMIADNAVPFEMLVPERLGPMEPHCPFIRCKQYWRVMA